MNPAPKLSNRQELWLFAVVYACTVAVVALAIAATVRLSWPLTGAAETLGAVFFFGLFAAGLPAVVAGLVGALHAIRVVNRQSLERPLWFWTWRGVTVGAALGVVSIVLSPAIFTVSSPGALIAAAAPLAAGIGATVGLLTAAYCWRVRR